MKNFELKHVDTSNCLKDIQQIFCLSGNEDINLIWEEFGSNFFSYVISNALDNFRKAIEDPNLPDINFKDPFIETSYPCKISWDELEPILNESMDADGNTTRIPLKTNHEKCFNILNRNRIKIANSEFEFQIPKEFLSIHSELIEGKKPDIFKTNNIPTSFAKFFCRYKRKNIWKDLHGVISVIFLPLLIIKSTKEIRFPVFVTLQTQKNIYEELTSKQCIFLLKELVEKISKDLNIEPSVDFSTIEKSATLSKPKHPLIKSPLHIETLKFGTKNLTTEQSELFTEVRSQNSKIEIIGLNLDSSHFSALEAIQKILASTNYKGNTKGRELTQDSNAFRFEGYLPRLRFTKAEYLEAYGVRKYKSSRGKWEYSGEQSRIALDALKVLGEKPHFIIAKRIKFENGKETVDRYHTISPILRICEGWEGLTKEEDKELDNGVDSLSLNEKHKGFVVEPCPLLVDQIDSYFVLRPANTHQEIRIRFPNASKFAHLFIDWIIKEATHKRRKSKRNQWPEFVEIGIEALAYALRMNPYIQKRDWKRINMSLSKCYEIAETLEWITSYSKCQGKTVADLERFYINPNKFQQIEENQPQLIEEKGKGVLEGLPG